MKKYQPQYLRYSKGFTFVEVLTSLVILSVALIPILTWLPTAIQTKLKAERKTTAVFLAQNKTEELHYQIIADFNKNYTVNSMAFNSPYQDFRYSITDQSLDGSLKLKTISVKVWHIEDPEDETIFYTKIAQR